MQPARRKLNQGQLDVLELLYKFRFGTTTLLAQGLKLKDGTYINSRLSILAEQGYVGRNYDKSYKLQGKPASFHLLPDAFKPLKQHADVSPKVLKNIYKDKDASEQFINHNLTVFAVYDKLNALYGDRVEFFTKSDLSIEAFDYFPESLPDAFISIKTANGQRARTKLFFIVILDDALPFFVNARRIKQLNDYADSGDWSVTGKKLPAVLAICESATLQKRLLKRFAGSDEMSEDFKLYTTTKDAFIPSSSENDDIWRSASKLGVMLSLSQI